MVTAFLLLFLGFIVLIVGAEMLVRGASGIALAFGLSPLVIGLTVVAFGTSSPELAVSCQAAATGQGGIVLGNIAGSNLVNVAVILALTAIICPLSVHIQVLRIDMPLMLMATVLFIFFVLTNGRLERWESALLFACLISYLVFVIRFSRKEAEKVRVDLAEIPKQKPGKLWLSLVISVIGLAMLVGGANLIVNNAILIAKAWGIGEALIGLTVIAIGTSLPELATSIMAAVKKQTDLAVGNIVGSNIFNLLCIGGIAGMVKPLENSLAPVDLGFMALTSILLLPMMRSHFKVYRWEGALLFACYVGYLIYRWP